VANQILSVIIPVINAEQTLPELVDDLLKLQTPTGWESEIIAGYSESHDDTLRILEDRGIKVVTSSTIGPGAARNAAVEEATGTYLYFIDSDARPVGEDFFFRLISAASRLDDAGQFGGVGGPILLSPSQRRNPIAQADHFACWFNWSNERADEDTLLFQPTVSLLMPRSVFDLVGGFDPKIRVLEDFEMQQRVLGAGRKLYFSQDIAVSHKARDTLLKSWRHSWYWGSPFRSAYFDQVPDSRLFFSVDSRWFWLNLPFIFLRRLRLVLRSASSVSTWRTLLVLPFIAATVFSWALATVLGGGQPPSDQPHAM
jgi:glycosyltransferase involved in cell wall biosynthesis